MNTELTSALLFAEIVSLDERGIVVKKDDELNLISFETDGGSKYWGFNEIFTSLLMAESEHPTITGVIDSRSPCGDSATILLLGVSKEDFENGILDERGIAEIFARSSEQDGWLCGASVKMVCNTLGVAETITSF